MTNSELAAAVAKALGLEFRLTTGTKASAWWVDPMIDPLEINRLESDGSNLFFPYWRCRCLDWLLDQPIAHVTFYNDQRHIAMIAGIAYVIACPAAEFPAQATAKLMEGK